MIPDTFTSIKFANNIDCKYSIITNPFNIKSLYILSITRFFVKLSINILQNTIYNIV